MRRTFIELALRTLKCNQKELAAKLKVSPTQITKWKQGEYMSFDMENKLREITGIGDMAPDFVLLAGTIEDAAKWGWLIHYLAEMADYGAETGYETYPLQDDLNGLCSSVFATLCDMGVAIPKKFPAELDGDYEDGDEIFESILENSYANLIYEVFKSLVNVYGFYLAYVYDFMNDEDLDLEVTSAMNIEPCLIDLAACKVEVDEKFAPKFRLFKQRVLNDYTDWLTIVKYGTMKAGLPLKAELLDLVYNSSEELRNDAEAENLGFNNVRLHPDIYMNELLTGMRTIHQVLPFIMKKMGIYEEFQLEISDLNIGG